MPKNMSRVTKQIGAETIHISRGFVKAFKQTHVHIQKITRLTVNGTVIYVRSVCRLVSNSHMQRKISKTRHTQKTTRQLSATRVG